MDASESRNILEVETTNKETSTYPIKTANKEILIKWIKNENQNVITNKNLAVNNQEMSSRYNSMINQHSSIQ